MRGGNLLPGLARMLLRYAAALCCCCRRALSQPHLQQQHEAPLDNGGARASTTSGGGGAGGGDDPTHPLLLASMSAASAASGLTGAASRSAVATPKGGRLFSRVGSTAGALNTADMQHLRSRCGSDARPGADVVVVVVHGVEGGDVCM